MDKLSSWFSSRPAIANSYSDSMRSKMGGLEAAVICKIVRNCRLQAHYKQDSRSMVKIRPPVTSSRDIVRLTSNSLLRVISWLQTCLISSTNILRSPGASLSLSPHFLFLPISFRFRLLQLLLFLRPSTPRHQLAQGTASTAFPSLTRSHQKGHQPM